MIFDATKVTYNMYSCSISGMSREMMKMDGRSSAEYQIWEMRDITVIFREVQVTTRQNSVHGCLLNLN